MRTPQAAISWNCRAASREAFKAHRRSGRQRTAMTYPTQNPMTESRTEIWPPRRHMMTRKFVGLVAVLVCQATVTSPENASAASAPQTKTQMPAAHLITPPSPKTNTPQPVHVPKEFLLNMKMNSQGTVKGKSNRETSTPVNGATVTTTKIHPSSVANKANPSPIDQVAAPSLDASSKDAAQMSVSKTFPRFSFDKPSAAANASAPSVTQSGEGRGSGNVILESVG